MRAMKIKVLSPIHIGTGEILDCFCYEESNQPGIVNCYDQSKAMAAVPADMLLDDQYLNMLRSAGADQKGNSSRYDRLLNTIRYDTLKPEYQLIAKGGLNYQKTAVQIKSLNRPYIPGSTIKGTLIHALLYRYIKENYDRCGIERIIAEEQNPNRFSAKTLFDRMLGSNTYALLSSALICDDIWFDKIGFYDRARINSKGGKIPMYNCEAIIPGQTAEQRVFDLQKERIQLWIDSGMQITDRAVAYLNQLDDKYILESLRIVAKDNLETECAYKYEINDIDQQLRTLQEKAAHSYIMRTGNSTDYWEKSISGLIKKNNPQFWRENFARKLSPLGNKLSPERMPVTRVILDDGVTYSLAGYLEITDEQ